MCRDLFKENYLEINKILNGIVKEIKDTIEVYSYKNKILDNTNNKEVLKKILTTSFNKYLMVSQAGSGKTYSLLKIANELDFLTVLAVPNRPQALQIEEEYKDLALMAVVGGVDVKKIDISKYKILVVVFEKLEEVVRTFNVDNLIIDEAQELVFEDFRVCTRDIEKHFVRMVKVNGEEFNLINIIYLTATPNVLMYLNFNKVFYFEKYEKDVFPMKYTRYKVKTIKHSLPAKIINNKNNGIKTIVRLNDTKELRDEIFEKIKDNDENIRIAYTSSQEKSFKIYDNKIVYDNDMTNCIINESCLPDADAMFCTSILDKGVNLNSIKNGELEKVEFLYVINGPADCLLDNLIQAEARIRNKYYKFSIMIEEKEENEDYIYRELIDLVKIYHRRLTRRKSFLENEILECKKDGFKDLEIIREIREQLNHQTIEKGLKANLDDTLSINSNLEILVNLKNFFRFVYLKYNLQLFFNPDKINEFFVNNDDKSFIDEKIEFIEFKENEEEKENEVDAILKEIKTNKCILNPSLSIDEKEKEENTIKHRKVSKSWKFKEFYNLKELGKDDNAAIDLVLEKDSKSIEKVKKDLVLEDIKKMTATDYIFISNYIKHKNDYKNIDLKEENLFTYKLKKTTYFDYFEKCVKKSYPLEKLVDTIVKGKSVTGFLKNEQYIRTNLKYMNEEKARGFEEKVQFFIIEHIGRYDHNSNTKLTKKKVKDLTMKVSQNFEEKYVPKDMEEVLHRIFKVGRDGRLNGLRIK